MPKEKKKAIRRKFNEDSIRRDSNRCRLCHRDNKTPVNQLEVHHITNRNDMPNGGYTVMNGITLCSRHHLKVETHPEFYTARMLYDLIGSSYERALDASNRLC